MSPEKEKPVDYLQMGGDLGTVEALLGRHPERTVGWIVNLSDKELDLREVVRISEQYDNLKITEAFERPVKNALQAASFFSRHAGYKLALSYAENILAREPENPNALFFKASSLFYQAKLDEAIETMEKLKTLKPEEVKRGLFYNDLLFLKKKYAQDHEGLRRHVRNEVQHELARTYKDEGDLEKALACYDTAIANDPQDLGSFSMKGGLLWSLSRTSEAYQCFKKAVECPCDENDRLQCFSKGLAHHCLGQFEEACRWYQRALEIEPYYDSALLNLLKAAAGSK